MKKWGCIGIFLIVGIAIAGAVLCWPNSEPSYHGRRLSWWVDQYGTSFPDQRDPEEAKAIIAIGTNALPYLMIWIRKVDEEPSDARHVISSILGCLPKAIEPNALAAWADRDTFRIRTGERAWSAAVAFSALRTNAEPYIPELKAMVADPTNGNVCLAAESALVHMGPDGFAAVIDVIAMPGLPQRGGLMQGTKLAEHMRVPDGMTLPGHEDPNFRINSIRAAPVLLKCLGDNDSIVRNSAFLMLCYSDPGVMVPALTNFLAGSPPPAVRRVATQALAKHGPMHLMRYCFFSQDIVIPIQTFASKPAMHLRK